MAAAGFFVTDANNIWPAYFVGMALSGVTRDYRAPGPALVAILLALGGNLLRLPAGTPMGDALRTGLTMNLVFLVVIAALQIMTTLRATKLQRIVGDVAAQEAMMRRLDETVARMQSAGASVGAAAASLVNGAGQAAGQVDQVLLPAVAELAEAQVRHTRIQEESMAGMESVGDAVGQVISAMNEQAGRVAEATRVAASIAEASQQTAEQAAAVAANATESAGRATEGNRLAAEARESTAHLQTALVEADAQMQALSERSSQIGQIVGTISGIAAQTNMLALNAAIEAARAGERGRGFAVVAEEVRRLSERSAHSAGEVAGLLHGIQNDVHTTANAINQGVDGAARVSSSTDLLTRALGSILEAADRTADAAGAIRAQSDSLAGGARSLADLVEVLGSITEETSAATEEMGSAIEQVKANTRDAAAMASQLAAASGHVAAAAEKIQGAAGITLSSARELGHLAAGLQQEDGQK
jgi:methyl-accepting chemotaxis protein